MQSVFVPNLLASSYAKELNHCVSLPPTSPPPGTFAVWGWHLGRVWGEVQWCDDVATAPVAPQLLGQPVLMTNGWFKQPGNQTKKGAHMHTTSPNPLHQNLLQGVSNVLGCGMLGYPGISTPSCWYVRLHRPYIPSNSAVAGCSNMHISQAFSPHPQTGNHQNGMHQNRGENQMPGAQYQRPRTHRAKPGYEPNPAF
jgi:hypothetical protein